MKSTPILFSAPMVRAILEGRKTQTRRVVKPQPIRDAFQGQHGDVVILGRVPARLRPHPENPEDPRRAVTDPIPCPYGAPGDRLWVRETWAPFEMGLVIYRASAAPSALPDGGKWRPSIFMPRWACRIELELTAVRVERVQEISADDACEEGIDDDDLPPECIYARLWDSINGKRAPWASNPWVWVLEFRRVQP